MRVVPTTLFDAIRNAAAQRCEYCLMSSTFSFQPHEVDHIISRKHGGRTEVNNLAFACFRCNRHKGPCIASLDYQGRLAPLFNPRTQKWHEHFNMEDNFVIVALTPIGEATIRILKLNTPERILERTD
jgi:hypothetical protein